MKEYLRKWLDWHLWRDAVGFRRRQTRRTVKRSCEHTERQRAQDEIRKVVNRHGSTVDIPEDWPDDMADIIEDVFQNDEIIIADVVDGRLVKRKPASEGKNE